MILNELKNHEIYPWFFASRKKGETLSFEFVDLYLLKEKLKNEKISDEVLQEILFGTGQKSFYTGWTLEVLKKVCEKTGWSIQWIQSENYISKVVCQKSELSHNVASDYFKNRIHYWIYNKRKELRYAVVGLKGRASALFKETSRLKKKPLWINLGAGEENYQEYLKVDWGKHQHIYDNIVSLGKFSKQSVDQIYSNHVLEHIPLFLVPIMLKRWKEVLKPGSKIYVRIPDGKKTVETIKENWQEAKDSEIKALGFPDYLHREKDRSGILDDQGAIQAIYGWSLSAPYAWDESNQHKTLWTPALARKYFEEAGFKVLESKNFGTIQTVLIASVI